MDKYQGFDDETKELIKDKLNNLGVGVKLVVKGVHGREDKASLEKFVHEFAHLGEGIDVKIENTPTEPDVASVELWINGDPTGLTFCGVPKDKEIVAFAIAVQNAAGKGDNMPDYLIRKRIENLEGPGFLFTFVSDGCPGCPDVMEAMNVIALINRQFKNTVIDVDAAPEFAKEYGVQGVPAVFANGARLSVGHATLGQLVADMEKYFGSSEKVDIDDHSALGFDVIIAGGGPAGAAAAVYLARKGVKTAVIADRPGGQVADTVTIDNVISVPSITGSQLADTFRKEMESYDIKLFDGRKIIESSLFGKVKRIKTDRGEWFETPYLIIATGASWKKLNVPGEDKYLGRGVGFCTHCDGPFYKGRNVAVVGGGNSGVEAAIDLAPLCKKVYLYEYGPELRADDVLKERLKSFSNVEVHLSSSIGEIKGNDTTGVTSIKVKDLKNGVVENIRVEGVFIQAGLKPNSEPFASEVDVNDKGEIIVDSLCRTNIAGVFAAGDVTDIPYKQIAIAIGEGAKAALTISADRIRGALDHNA